MIEDAPANEWEQELEELFLRVGHRFSRVEPRRRMRDYVRGLLSPVDRKNSWQLAEFTGHSTPDGLQHLLAKSRWEADEIRDDLHSYVAEHLGADDGVLIIDDTGFVKKGITSAGVQRQYSGTAGRTENCQIGVFAAYATTLGHALVDRELYLPKSWTDDAERCRAAKIPSERGFATKNDLARTMVQRALASPLPVTWVAADAAYGQDSRSRYIVIAKVVAEPSGRAVCTAFAEAMTAYGVPSEVLTDNGKQFTGRFTKPAPAEVLFERICRENGITARLTKPRSPNTTGKIERFHKTLRRELLEQVGQFADQGTTHAATAYNHSRPHQWLAMATPASVFRPNPVNAPPGEHQVHLPVVEETPTSAVTELLAPRLPALLPSPRLRVDKRSRG